MLKIFAFDLSQQRTVFIPSKCSSHSPLTTFFITSFPTSFHVITELPTAHVF